MNQALFCWSGGKDSALALHRVRGTGEYRIVSLFTTVNSHYGRVSMHGVRLALIEQQAFALGMPLQKMAVGKDSTNEEYLAALRALLERHRQHGVTHVIFGDIFLEDLRQWREALLRELGLSGVFPIWREDTAALYREFLRLGFQAVTCCVNDACLNETHVGRRLDEGFLATLPAGVDPCGENGEYHSFVHDGPIFSQPVRFNLGEKVYRPLPGQPTGAGRTKGFWYCDLVPTAAERRKICPACGRPFTCHAGDCWCSEIAVPAAVRQRLREQYDNCLCKDCLAAAVAR